MTQFFSSLEEGFQQSRNALGTICERVSFFEIVSDRHELGKHVLALKSIFHEPYNIKWLKSEHFRSILKNWLQEKSYDLVHFDTISLVPFFDALPKGIASSLDHHNIESHMLLRRVTRERNIFKKAYFWQEGLRLQKYERRYCPEFSLNITCSDMDTKRLQKLAPKARVETIPNGVDMGYFKPGAGASDSRFLIFVGSMGWYPNVEAVQYIANKLWPRLKEKHPDLEFHVVGANPPGDIQKLSTKLHDFYVHGFVDDVRPFLDAAAVYVCPIQDGGGTKLKILDAMAMEKAIVAHPIACEGINVKHGANIFLAESDHMFIEQIDDLLRNPEKRKHIGRAARELMKSEYDYRSIGKKLSDAFQDCLS
ncbi:MAG: glycosyltransferase [Desulfovermiculus sp.]|nr:glycosyltransferase [Desulfovermiculus sp.]